MIKRIGIIFVCCLATIGLTTANQPVRKTIYSGGFEREYLIYMPQRPQPEKARGIIVCLHGFGRSVDDFFNETDFSVMADSLNLIILAPQALPEQNQLVVLETSLLNLFTNNSISLRAVWGCGLSIRIFSSPLGITLLEEELNRDIDDVYFINQLIDTVLAEYSMQPDNLFALGTSMGGYMTYQFALKKGDRLSGIISLAGSMGLRAKGMDYTLKVPVCDFHSVSDNVVPYSGSQEQFAAVISLAQAKTDVIDYWKETNSTGAPVVENVQYYPSTNGITVDKITYPEAINEVIHYKMNGAHHSYFFKKESGDCMDYREEVAKFIQSHISGVSNNVSEVYPQKLSFYPNPARDFIYFETITGTVSVYLVSGQKVFSESLQSGKVDLSSLKPGIYILRIQSENTIQTHKLIKQ